MSGVMEDGVRPDPTCEAVTGEGARCKRPWTAQVAVAGRPARLCGRHARQARHGRLVLWTPDRPDSTADRPDSTADGRRHVWSAEEDAYLLRNAFLPVDQLATKVSRSSRSVLRRLFELRRHQQEAR